MRNLRNPNLKGSKLNIRGTEYEGDADGVFSLRDEHAKLVEGTPHWEPARKRSAAKAPAKDPVADLRAAQAAAAAAKPPPPAAEPKSAPEPAAADPDPPEEAVPVTADEPEAEAEADDGDPEEGPDLDSMTTKAALLDVAKDYGVKLSAEQRKLGVDELRKVLDHELYGDGGDGE